MSQNKLMEHQSKPWLTSQTEFPSFGHRADPPSFSFSLSQPSSGEDASLTGSRSMLDHRSNLDSARAFDPSSMALNDLLKQQPSSQSMKPRDDAGLTFPLRDHGLFDGFAQVQRESVPHGRLVDFPSDGHGLTQHRSDMPHLPINSPYTALNTIRFAKIIVLVVWKLLTEVMRYCGSLPFKINIVTQHGYMY